MSHFRIGSHEFLVAVQARAARVAVGASAIRGQGKGVALPARNFLASLPLREFSTTRRKQFALRLDARTAELQRRFPKGTGSWGLARKLLNIFLREALYTTYLTESYKLAKSEPFLEVPLDSITGKQLCALPASSLCRWPGVKHLKPDLSAEYQAVAETHAQAAGISRVHLDALWWGQRKGEHAA